MTSRPGVVRAVTAHGLRRAAAIMDRCIWLADEALQPRAQALACRRHNLAYRGCPEDLFIVGYPRSGMAMIQMLLHEVIVGDSLERVPHLGEFAPLIDALIRPGSAWNLDAAPGRHIVRSRLSYDLVPKGPGRYVYVVRHGLDVAVSYYWLHRSQGYQGTLPEFVDLYLRGRLTNGTWFEHVGGWLRNPKRLRVCYVSYEDLRRDFVAAARRVVAFCGLDVAAGAWPRIAANCSFETMRRHEQKFQDRHDPHPEQRHFIRRGRSGEWREHVGGALVRRFSVECARAFRGVPVPDALTAVNGASGS